LTGRWWDKTGEKVASSKGWLKRGKPRRDGKMVAILERGMVEKVAGKVTYHSGVPIT